MSVSDVTMDPKDNILVSHDGRPLITDFGNSRTISSGRPTKDEQTTTGSLRWMAKELLEPKVYDSREPGVHTKPTDMWAFGMVILVSRYQ